MKLNREQFQATRTVDGKVMTSKTSFFISPARSSSRTRERVPARVRARYLSYSNEVWSTQT